MEKTQIKKKKILKEEIGSQGNKAMGLSVSGKGFLIALR